MKNIFDIPNKALQLFVLTALIFISMPSNAHLVGISWVDMGDNTVRFYGETAHDGYDEVAGGALAIGPWSTRELYYWTDAITDTTLADLNVDGMAYWDPDGEESIVSGTDYYDAHTGGAGYYNYFFFVDVTNFYTGDYLLQAEGGDGTAVDRRLGNDYLNAYIEVASAEVPEPPVFVLFGMGLLAMFIRRKAKNTKSQQFVGQLTS